MSEKKVFLRQVVYDELRSSIMNNELMPGDRLIESRIGKKYGASRTPVRDALQQLSEEGLAKYFPRKGYIVAKISMKETTQLYEVRRLLEPGAMEHIAERGSEEDKRKLRDIVDRISQALSEEEYDQVRSLIKEWNAGIYQAIKNPYLKNYLDTCNKRCHRVWNYLFQFETNLVKAVKYYARMIDLMEEGDSKDIFLESRNDIDGFYRSLQSHRDPRIFYF